jgi:hypothetical protein
LEEGNYIGRGPLGDLEQLDIQLESILSSGSLAKIGDTCVSHNDDLSTSRGTPRTESEIIVRVDDMDTDMASTASLPLSQKPE